MTINMDFKWYKIKKRLEDNYGQKLDLNSILFLIGLQEVGIVHKKLSKKQKLEIIHVAVCKLLSFWGYYEFEGNDADGWPHYKKTNLTPCLTILEQEKLIKDSVVEYFS